jgi:hypothetical protein
MNDVTRIISAVAHSDPRAAELLLPLVYDELRRLAARRLAGEDWTYCKYGCSGSGSGASKKQRGVGDQNHRGFRFGWRMVI